ncbi:NUDIX domain-containing protein [Aliihoeflea sp. PC F10.4]
MSDAATRSMPTVSQWLRVKLFHGWFLLRRPMTLGVRGIVHDAAAGTVFLIRHTYIDGWQFPGGGVEVGETMRLSLERELAEEGNIEMTDEPRLISIHLNRQASQRDHVALYLVSAYRQTAPKLPDHEIAEAGFFPLDALPEETTPATRRRLAEVFGGAAADLHW